MNEFLFTKTCRLFVLLRVIDLSYAVMFNYFDDNKVQLDYLWNEETEFKFYIIHKTILKTQYRVFLLFFSQKNGDEKSRKLKKSVKIYNLSIPNIVSNKSIGCKRNVRLRMISILDSLVFSNPVVRLTN